MLVITKLCKECALNYAVFLTCLSGRQKSQQIHQNHWVEKGWWLSSLPAGRKPWLFLKTLKCVLVVPAMAARYGRVIGGEVEL